MNDQYLHKNFRFRFQNFGKLNGPFDSWVIDYIYLNNDRKSNDTIYNDRSLTYKPKNYFKNFTSIPIEQFQNDPDFFLDTIHVGLNNFNDQIQPLEYNCIVYDLIDKISIDTISWKEALDPLIKGFEKSFGWGHRIHFFRIVLFTKMHIKKLLLRHDAFIRHTFKVKVVYKTSIDF